MLHIHRAERADRLAHGLAETLTEPLADAFTPEVIAVPTRGIERWLAQHLSTRLGATVGRADGVCANVEFPFPARLIAAALAMATGIQPDSDPWLAERSVWPLLEVVDECLGEPWLAALARHLRGAPGRPDGLADSGPEHPPRRFATVRHIAGLFDRYGVHRPDMVRRWAAADLEDDDGWQAELWRRLRRRIDLPSPAERLPAACAAIRQDPDALELPSRLSLFGLTRMPRSHLEVIGALAHRRDIHLFVLHPSPELFRDVEEALRTGPAVTTRREDRTARLPVNRLLASWGRDARELHLLLAAGGPSVDHHHAHHDGARESQSDTLLGKLQAGIRANRRPPGPPLTGEPDRRQKLDPQDDSVQIHACHGRARQVEVLRDAILHQLEADPTLEPRDVIVMCPDIETFAPLIQATFGAGRPPRPDHDEGDEPETTRLPDLRVRLADRSLRQTNPVLTVVSQLLGLADQRATASQLLDLASREPVRRRFDFNDDDLARIRDWVAASGIRWGFDQDHRAPYNLGNLKANTWRKGLDRVLTGVAMTEEGRRLVNGVLPLDDVESGAIDLAGRFAEFVDRVHAAAAALAFAKPITDWVHEIGRSADALTATSDRDAWQRRELQRILDDVITESDPGPDAALELADVRALLADRLRGRPTRANFRTGHLTICTLVPMRSVPHRVVCILGLDDGEFPRKARRDGDDLLLADPRIGDRDPRSEDRQLLLDALMAATERLIITYTGNDERTNLPRPPAVPVAELLDAIDRTVSGPAREQTAREQIQIRHPLQPFDPRNFKPGALIGNEPWGFDRRALQGAEALAGPRTQPRAFLTEPLPPLTETLIDLDRLVRFVERPVRALLRDRLGVNPTNYFEDTEDAIPVELDGLKKWEVGQRLLEGVLAGADMDACLLAEQARGSLPPGRLAIPVLEEIREQVRPIARHAEALVRGAPPQSVDVNLELAGGRALAGTVMGVHSDTTLLAVSFSRVRPRDRLRAWVRMLALTAARPDRDYESVVVGRARPRAASSAQVTVARIRPLGEDPASRQAAALAHLTILLDLYDRGMREPLPIACDTTAAYAAATRTGGDAVAAALEAWASDYDRDREDREPEHTLAFGGQATLTELMSEPPRADEHWERAQPTRFGSYALRLWSPLLAAEECSDL